MNNPSTSQLGRQAIADAHVIISGHFIFADGAHATKKVEMDQLWKSPDSLGVILDLLARAEGLPPADVIMGVPRGGQDLAIEVAGRTGLPIAMLERIPGAAKQDFRFASPQDQDLALSATSIRIYEDVVTTLSSIAGVVRLLDPNRQRINSLAIWRRGQVKNKYQRGVSDHYLIEELMPNYSPDACPVCSAKVKTQAL